MPHWKLVGLMRRFLMNKLKVNMRYILIIAALMCFSACQNGKTTTANSSSASSSAISSDDASIQNSKKNDYFKDSLAYKTISFYKETKKSSLLADSNKFAYVKASYPQFADKQVFLNKEINTIITAKPWTGEPAENIEAATASFFKDYYNFKKDAPDSPAGYEWINNVEVSFQDTNLVVLTTTAYVYTGGAHGLESITYKNLDVKNKKEIALKDLFLPNFNSKLTKIAESIFRKDEGLTQTEPLENYFFENKAFTLNNNFAITKKGLLFTYNPYEIKSYAEGTTNLLIPYLKIKNLIKPKSFISTYIK